MPTREIAALPVAGACRKDCVLFLWVTAPFLAEGLKIVRAWGFKYSTVAFNWVKINKHENTPCFGNGYWTRSATELCILATRGRSGRGRLTKGAKNRDIEQLVFARRSIHSRKPSVIRDRIERLASGPYLELFARQPAERWDSFGDHFGADGPPPTDVARKEKTTRSSIKVTLTSDRVTKPRRPKRRNASDRIEPRPATTGKGNGTDVITDLQGERRTKRTPGHASWDDRRPGRISTKDEGTSGQAGLTGL